MQYKILQAFTAKEIEDSVELHVKAGWKIIAGATAFYDVLRNQVFFIQSITREKK